MTALFRNHRIHVVPRDGESLQEAHNRILDVVEDSEVQILLKMKNPGAVSRSADYDPCRSLSLHLMLRGTKTPLARALSCFSFYYQDCTSHYSDFQQLQYIACIKMHLIPKEASLTCSRVSIAGH
jgi:hypothetical protein